MLRIPDLKGRLTFSGRNQNQLIGTLYAPGVSRNSGWKDATKQWGNVDTGLCFAASSSNLISWYLERYLALHPDDTHGFETNPERIFDRFRNGWDSAEGGDQKEALSWSLVSFNWEPAEDFSVFGSYEDNSFPYIEDVGGVGPGLPFSNLKRFSQHILRQLHYGPCTISIITDQAGGGSGHAITLWGCGLRCGHRTCDPHPCHRLG